MTEAQLQSAIIDCARSLGWLVYHTHDSRHSPAGYPDLTLGHGRFGIVFAELKDAKRKTTFAQETWLEVLAEHENATAGVGRVQVFLWRPDDWTSGRVEQVLRGR